MKIVVGLGNPGRQYDSSRHNAGFRVLDHLVSCCSASPGVLTDNTHPFILKRDWANNYSSLVAEVSLGQESLILMKPQTFMNRSGQAVQQAAQFFKLPVEEIVVVHDEIDLPLGVVRLRKGGGEAGHNGLRSVSEFMASKDYFRVRVGVGRPLLPQSADGDERGAPPVRDWVLSDFSRDEEPAFVESVAMAVRGLAVLLVRGLGPAQQEIHSFEKKQGQ